MTTTKQPTFEQMPAFLAQLAENYSYLKEHLPQNNSCTEIEQPINVQQCADYLGFDIQTIYRMVRGGRIPHHKKTARLYFFKSELNDWIKEGTNNG